MNYRKFLLILLAATVLTFASCSEPEKKTPKNGNNEMINYEEKYTHYIADDFRLKTETAERWAAENVSETETETYKRYESDILTVGKTSYLAVYLWETNGIADTSSYLVEKYVDACMKAKCAPVHSIEPQILQAALQAKADGVTMMLVGESSDLVFGGMDGLLAKDWAFDEFVKRYTFLDPREVLKNPVDMSYLYERYRKPNGKIDFLSFMDNVFSIESSSSYLNAFATAKMSYYDPYCRLKMADPLDLQRVRNGEPKYLIRQLMAKKYPDIPVPNKVPMPRPVDVYFKDWKGVTRSEFRSDIDYAKLSGNQKWQLWCLERFLNNLEEA